MMERSDISTVDREELPDPTTGLWECLSEPRTCRLAAPDPRTPATLFEGPTHAQVRDSNVPVACPECKGEKVIYRGDKLDAEPA